ncbi:MAG: DNA polymerase [Desulfuromonas sp.]|nr:MAG: DNA polymerase [Desulfuromonas sp.]
MDPQNEIRRLWSEAVAQSRGLLQELQQLGIESLHLAEIPDDLPPCPPKVIGVDQGGATPCRQETLEEIRQDLGECSRCALSKGRQQIVFGVGNPKARLVLVGEAPGREEDERGEPFVGEAGRLLDKILAAMGLMRDDVYICNVQKCRPPSNRDPKSEEIAACQPFLRRQLAAIRPDVIISLGRFSSQILLETAAPVGRLRGQWRRCEGVDLMPTFHPAYLLRNPLGKREVWEDMKLVMARLRSPAGGQSDGDRP